MDQTVRTTCPYCGVGCGVSVTADKPGGINIQGDPDHPANFGRLCSKGSALDEVLGHEGRLLHPEVNGRRVSWGRALDEVAGRFRTVIDTHGPDAVAFYVSGQLLTEDYYVANKLMKGFIGSANIDTNSRLCMSSSVAGHKRAFGADVVPGCYEDLEEADLVVLVGSNLAWCHPVLYQRLTTAKTARPELKVVVVDPRRTPTAETADLHLPLASGSDIALFQGLLGFLDQTGRVDEDFVAAHTEGVSDVLAAAACVGFDAAQTATELDPEILKQFYELFAGTEKVVTVFSQGVNQSRFGTDKVNAIINCHLLTGRIGKPGMGPFSITGQPNAMGGREVGGLANQLACHMEIGNPDHRALVQGFWASPRIADRPGLKAVELFQTIEARRIKAVWIMATNPVDSLPDADRVRRALAQCETVVVSDVTADTDTAKLAHILLPAAAWGEKDGTVTNSERRISRQRAFRAPPGEARPDWRIICDVAARLGWAEHFAYDRPAAIFREYAALSGHRNGGGRAFDIGALATLSDADYKALAPVQWPLPVQGKPAQRLFADGRFFTSHRRARFIIPAKANAEPGSTELPYVLNTGRVRDHWHTMTRTGESVRLSQHMAEPFVEIHPEDALREGIGHASLVEIENSRGRIVVRALITPRQQAGALFVPIHWTGQFASKARVDILVPPVVDPVSGQPDSKGAKVKIRPFTADWYGFAVICRRPLRLSDGYWALARCQGGWRVEMAGLGTMDDAADQMRNLLLADCAVPLEQSFHDVSTQQYRMAAFEDGALVGLGFLAAGPVAVSRRWAASWLAKDSIQPSDRARLLAGQAGRDRPDSGATICACFDIGMNDIRRAIARSACRSVDEVGAQTKAGTNCGSCRAEVKRIIEDVQVKEAV